MNNLVATSYALGGGCFAILLSGQLDDKFCDAHRYTANLLAAGIPCTLAAAAALESGIKARQPWYVTFGCLMAMLVALAGITCFFFVSHPNIRDGYLGGLAIFLSFVYRGYIKKPKPGIPTMYGYPELEDSEGKDG